MPESTVPNLDSTDAAVAPPPDFVELVGFLLQPFLESSNSLRVDCEISPRRSHVLIRLAFEGEDKGRVFGRGGRNIQAIRTALQAVAQTAGYTAHLEIYGGGQAAGREERSDDRLAPSRSSPRRSPRSRSS
ncbi:MAG: KH domain-containing protein [Leptolyngbyaceae cyanobacterium SL_7_1]|nr:KH domain-containing protein [Leptolyngbyaceae cyanobacterium SL_7_1]